MTIIYTLFKIFFLNFSIYVLTQYIHNLKYSPNSVLKHLYLLWAWTPLNIPTLSKFLSKMPLRFHKFLTKLHTAREPQLFICYTSLLDLKISKWESENTFRIFLMEMQVCQFKLLGKLLI